jgi:hypothetical protein
LKNRSERTEKVPRKWPSANGFRSRPAWSIAWFVRGFPLDNDYDGDSVPAQFAESDHFLMHLEGQNATRDGFPLWTKKGIVLR